MAECPNCNKEFEGCKNLPSACRYCGYHPESKKVLSPPEFIAQQILDYIEEDLD